MAMDNYPQEKREYDTPFLVRFTCVLISLCILVYIAIVGKTIIVPLILGFLVAMLMLPLSSFQEKKLKIPRIISSLVSTIVFSLMLVAVGYFFGLQITTFQEDLPEFKLRISQLLQNIQTYIYNRFGISEQEQMAYITKNAESLIKESSKYVETVFQSLSSLFFTGSFVFLNTFFFLLYRSHLSKFIVWTFSPQYQEKVRSVITEIQRVVKQYIFGLMIQVVIVSILMYIAFLIIGIKYSLMFAILCGVLNLIPYVGIFSATLLAAIVTLATDSPIQALWVIVSVVIVNSIDGNIITPKVVGSQVSLNSYVVLIGLLIAQSIWGIAGMFLAIPVLAIVKIVFDNVESLRPYGFLLGEEGAETPLFEKNYRVDNAKTIVPEDHQEEEQNVEKEEEQ